MTSNNPRFTTTISGMTSTTQRTTTNNSHGILQFYKLETIFLNPYIRALQFILYSLTIKPIDLETQYIETRCCRKNF
jgi:hypothetical protein